MSTELLDIVHAVVAKAPQWIRQDLLSKEALVRERAEEALAAMIASAIEEAQPHKAA
ncbi:hypothetical protein [Sphingomonas koreensis]|uniref:hypothetical protein n=1 Tax=Sphingomonas koreensis TaxID=93064 RepID=UPI000AD4D352|nr:hypothetical protein [Sphingomonas koreensis]PJI88466.1 hypothetical protein BDW16_1743 [Sphingomonas koreensis]